MKARAPTKTDDAGHRARYALAHKLQADGLPNAGQVTTEAMRPLNMPRSPLGKPVQMADEGELQGAGD